VPFLIGADGSLADTLRHCSLLLLLGGIYFLRARTEEAHLSHDPDYRSYAEWIAVHGLFARLRGLVTTLTADESSRITA